MAKGAYIGVDGKARKIKAGYIGAMTDIPIYETRTVTETITASNITEFFEVENGSPYYFVGNGSVFTSNNKGVSSSTAVTHLKPKYDMVVSATVSVSCESNYDKFNVTGLGVAIKLTGDGAVHSEENVTVTPAMGIEFEYIKDGSADNGDDEAKFYDMVVTCTKPVLVDVETRSAARRIKKAYIGIGGVARPCFGGGELVYYGKIANLSSARYRLAATSVGDYAIFAGGHDKSTLVDAYNSNLTHTSPLNISEGRYDFAATTVGNYALFGGGRNGSSYKKTVDAITPSFTLTSTTLIYTVMYNAATTVGNYALFAGGRDTSEYVTVTSFTPSLTMSSPSDLSVGRYDLTGVTVGGYALFAGGTRMSGSVTSGKTVDAYNASLTRTTHSEGLPFYGCGMSSTAVGDYALIGCGLGGSSTGRVCAFDTSLTRHDVADMTVHQYEGAATSVNGFALFGGSSIGGGSTLSDFVDAYDVSLTKTAQLTLSSPTHRLAATTVGDYALFGGGNINWNSNTATATVDVYTVD